MNRLIKAHDGCQQGRGDANISEPLEQGFPRDRIKSFPKIYKTTVDFQRAVSCLLNDGPEGEDVVNSLVSLSSSSELSLLKVTGELHMENCIIQYRECVAHHDRPVVVEICAWTGFMNQMDDVV